VGGRGILGPSPCHGSRRLPHRRLSPLRVRTLGTFTPTDGQLDGVTIAGLGSGTAPRAAIAPSRSRSDLPPQQTSTTREQADSCDEEHPGPTRAAVGGQHHDRVDDDQCDAGDHCHQFSPTLVHGPERSQIGARLDRAVLPSPRSFTRSPRRTASRCSRELLQPVPRHLPQLPATTRPVTVAEASSKADEDREVAYEESNLGPPPRHGTPEWHLTCRTGPVIRVNRGVRAEVRGRRFRVRQAPRPRARDRSRPGRVAPADRPAYRAPPPSGRSSPRSGGRR
jgi:hypothetical protein